MAAVHATIARQGFAFTRDEVEASMRGIEPERIQTHYVVVGRRRFPPKQVISAVTGLDRSAFISTQARNLLERLGFTVGRVGSPPRAADASPPAAGAADERFKQEAELLRPYQGQYVAVDPTWTEVIASGPDPRSVARALRTVNRSGTIFQVPTDPSLDVGAFAW